MKQEDWTSRLRERLEGYETPAPEGLWQQIEQSLPAERKSRVRPLKRWLAAAAAAMLVGGVGLGLLWKSGADNALQTSEDSRDSYNINNVAADDTRKQMTEDEPADVSDALVAQTLTNGTEDIHISVGNKNIIVTRQVVDGEAVGYSIKVEEKIKEDVPATNEPMRTEMRGETSLRPSRAQTSETRQQMYVRKPRFYQRFSAGLMASSLAMANSKSTMGVLAPQVRFSPARADGFSNDVSMVSRAPEYVTGFEERTEHKAPLTFGLKLGYSITQRLWVESGVQYSKLSSTFVRDMRGSELTSEQALHYVGVPLGVGYRIFDVGPLSFYGIAGAQADFNVKAKSSTEGVETTAVKDDVQFSANAALGAQVKLTPHLGIYVEPGARYYFDNGSDVQNYFKDKKLNFNLQVGARWNIGGK